MIVIDYSQVAIASITADLSNEVTLTTDLVRHMVLNAIRSYKVKFSKDYGQIVIAVDSRNYWRKKIFPYYKANRKKLRDDSILDWEMIHKIIKTVKLELIEYFPYPVMEIEGAEADDIIATLAKWSQDHDGEENSILDTYYPQSLLIISGDHDFQQLQKYDNVSQYVPAQQKLIELQQSPDLLLKEHIIRGDAGDGVPNFLSDDDTFVNESKKQRPIFAKKVEEWVSLPFEEIAELGYIQLYESYKRAEKKAKKSETSLPPEPPLKDELVKNLERNRSLVDLSQIPTELELRIIQTFEELKDSKDKSKLYHYMIRNGLNNLLESIGDF